MTSPVLPTPKPTQPVYEPFIIPEGVLFLDLPEPPFDPSTFNAPNSLQLESLGPLEANFSTTALFLDLPEPPVDPNWRPSSPILTLDSLGPISEGFEPIAN